VTAEGGGETRTFDPSPEAPRHARRFVAHLLGRLEADSVLDQTVLLVSELVTNAVLHARTPVTVEVSLTGDVLRVGVGDASPTPPAMRSFSALAGSGRGLHLVASMSRTWGVDDRPDGGKIVWFEIDVASNGSSFEFDLDAVQPL
jgi:anti-sigma regulatory factor (Ser/Thr protein kinase)